MSVCCPLEDARKLVTAEFQSGMRDRFLVGLVVLTLIHTSGALAGDQASVVAAAKPKQNDFFPQSTALSASASLFAAPEIDPIPGVSDTKIYSSRDFRPRGHSIFDTDSRLSNADDALINDATVGQRLSEYRERDRVQVLTLWRSGAGTVSLQAGKRGDPSLQWTSRLMNRGGATHGLLDRLLPLSSADSTVVHSGTHPANPQPVKGATSLGALRLGATSPP
jgi:hypothetical protein